MRPRGTAHAALEALAAGLAERGLPTRMFGAAVPAEALDAAVRRSGPAVVVSGPSPLHRPPRPGPARRADGVRDAGARTSPLVLLAGPGWLGRTPAPGTVRPSGLREALAVVSRLYGEGGEGEGGEGEDGEGEDGEGEGVEERAGQEEGAGGAGG
ncbi:hypothetical protein O1L60_42890 [Streptomyces diastatochromogenes]|nr:hypothetical protein [Streptomyces diastatochromogenes]